MVSLGFVDYTLEEGDDNDPYQSKIGGVPVWVSESDLIPKASELVCKVCSKRLFFVAQFDSTIADSIYSRVLYIFGCIQYKCQTQIGSWVVLRCQITKPSTTTISSESKIEKIELMETDQSEVKDDWGIDASDWSMESEIEYKPNNFNFDDMEQALDSQTKQEVQTKPEKKKAKKKSLKQNDFNDYSFESSAIYFDDEPIQKEKKPSKKQLAMYEQMEKDLDEGTSGGWEGEGYEKTQHKHIENIHWKFQKRISLAPTQVVRFPPYGETPLLYRSIPNETLLSIPTCSNCKSPRLLECQLMPGLLNVLQPESHPIFRKNNQSQKTQKEKVKLKTKQLTKSQGTSSKGKQKGDEGDEGEDIEVEREIEIEIAPEDNLLSLLNQGNAMEWGTILIYTCKNSCHIPNSNFVCFEEFAIVQPIL